jgi:phosphatidylserine decarboxylase
MIAKEGLKTIFSILVIVFIAGIVAALTNSIFVKIIFCLSLIILTISLYFFRDPKRVTTDKENALVSPCDGKVVAIERVDDEFVDSSVRISVFLSIFDIHINRIPFSGLVKRIDYKTGKFKSAIKNTSSFENERNTLFIENEKIKFKVTQIAGLVARRIVSYLHEGDFAKKGDRYGLIMFGSRVDLIIPDSINITVKVGDRLKGGVSIIGEIV